MSYKSILIILDGWGVNPDPKISSIEAASTPYMDGLLNQYPHTTLVTHGEDVGLPEGQMGNSEVGHLNIGAGRIIYQELAKINQAIRTKALDQNATLLKMLQSVSGTLHIMGLVSDGGVHSHVDHLVAMGRICRQHVDGNIHIHAFADGRDVDPKSGLGFMRSLKEKMDPLKIPIVSVIGRYYAMDRDKRWARIKLAYDLLVHGKGHPTTDILHAIHSSYEEGITDEFIRPIVLVDQNAEPVSKIRNGDTVIFFNFRTDRPRQLTEVLTQHPHPEEDMTPLSIQMVTMTQYDESFEDIPVLFPDEDISGTLGEYLSSLELTQLRVAETEKYPHVTYFFSGGREAPFPGEQRILIPSPKVATYDLKPEMSAHEVTAATMEFIRHHTPDFICLNYANADMVGHTGDFRAAVKAVETVDQCLSRLIPLCLEHNYRIIIIADHGNADVMVNEDGSPNTAHTKNPVPLIYLHPSDRSGHLQPGRLADIAPTLLHVMGLSIPQIMTGEVLLKSH